MRKNLAILFISALALAEVAPLATFKFDGTSDTAVFKGQFRYEPGLQGKALVLGDATATLPCPPKLTPAEGTLAMWVKPLNWDMNVKEFVTLVQCLSPDRTHRLLLYKYSTPGLGLTFWLGAVNGEKSKDNRYANQKAATLPKGQWTRLAITWSRKASLLAINVDGVQVASASYSERMAFPAFGDFVLNAPPFRPANRKYETAFDLVQFYGAALSEDELARTYENERGGAAEVPIALLRQTILTVPTLAKPPKLDGSFEAPEWAGAAQTGCFTTLSKPQLVLRPSTDAYVAHHDEKLYFCFIGKIPNATTLVSEVTKRDGSVYADDAYEIHLRPPEMTSGYYQGIFNSIDTIFDAKTGESQWNADWQIKNGIYEGQWICEIALPLKEVGSHFAEGAGWKFNLCRDRKVFPEILFSSVSPSAMPFFAHYGDFRLTAQGCYGRLSLDCERLFARSLELKFTVGNCGSQPRQATVQLEKYDASGTLLDTQTRELTIPGQGSAETVWEDPLTGFRSGFLRLTAKEADGTIFHRQDMPLVFKDEVNILTETNLEQATLRCSVDMSSHYRLAETATAIAELRTESGKAVSLRLEGTPLAKGVFDLSPIPPGDCVITIRFLDKDGKELLAAKQPYKHIGQPRWLTEKPGEDAGVVWPYTPILRQGNILNVWGRSHQLGGGLLPAQITSQGTQLFTVPPVLKTIIDGRKGIFSAFQFRPVQLDGARTTYQFSANAEKLQLDGTVTLEFDGLLWYDFQIQGPGKIDCLELEMTMPPSVAQFYNAHFFSRENYVGRLEKELQLKRIPSIWLGNLEVGLTFCTESFQDWRNANETNVFTITPQKDSVKWTARFIDTPTALGNGLHYSFGLEANPVKPTQATFRSWRVTPFKPGTIAHPWNFPWKKLKKYPDSGILVPEHTSMEAFREEAEAFRSQGVEMTLYLNPFLASPQTTEFQVFRKQWRNPYNVYPICPASSFTDYTVWQVNECIQKGALQCVYVDSLGAVNCANPLHGCGYLDAQGKQHLTWPIRPMRKYMQRLYSLLHAEGRDQSHNFLWAHMSARTSAPINAFVDFQCSGEELEKMVMTNSNYLELYPLDAFEIYYSRSAGVTPMLLPNLGRCGPKEARWKPEFNDQILALVLLHDVLLWPAWTYDRYINQIYAKLDAWGYRDPSLQYHSYRTQTRLTADSPAVKISLYTLGEKTLAVAVNTAKTPVETTFSHPNGFRDLRTGQDTPAKVTIPGYNFALLELK